MFERFTENARRTVFFARWEAIQRGSEAIESEHISLALVRDPWLVETFLQPESVTEIQRDFPPVIEEEKGRAPDVPLSNESKRVLQLGAEEADALLDRHIGNEHLLLGLLREKRCKAAGTLRRGGLELGSLRARVKDISRESRKANGAGRVARWRAAGIPEGYDHPKLSYNPASGILVLQLEPLGGGTHQKCLFMRRKGAETYEPIESPGDGISCESLVTCEKRPVLAFNAMRFTERGSGNWVGIYVFDLEKRELSLRVSTANFLAPSPYTGGWIGAILNLSDDAEHAHVNAGLELRREDGADMHYYVARLNLTTRQLDLISRLENVFF